MLARALLHASDILLLHALLLSRRHAPIFGFMNGDNWRRLHKNAADFQLLCAEYRQLRLDAHAIQFQLLAAALLPLFHMYYTYTCNTFSAYSRAKARPFSLLNNTIFHYAHLFRYFYDNCSLPNENLPGEFHIAIIICAPIRCAVARHTHFTHGL